jgi:predicted transcriptional regulator
MSGVPKLNIAESADQLLEVMKKQKSSLPFVKVQALYLFQIKAAETVRHLAILVGRDETTVHRWLRSYREGGIEALLEEKKPSGRPKKKRD